MDFIYRYEDLEDMSKNGKNIAYVDCRTPREFKAFTIPGAFNIPVLLDKEHETIGIMYKEKRIEEAKIAGVGFISKRLPDIFEKIVNLTKKYDHVVLFCSRGGYRSTVLFNTLRSLKINVFKLDGGYKHYRKAVMSRLVELIDSTDFRVLNGGTGCGKTEILKALRKKGEPVIDLEDCANHRGSLLGHIGLGDTRTQKMFESLIYDELKNNDRGYIYCEGESKRIGNVFLPDALKEKMNLGYQILVETPIKKRVEIIKNEYVLDNSKEELIQGVEKLNKYISKDNIQRYSEDIRNGNYDKVIEDLILSYYDKAYNTKTDCEFTIVNEDSSIAAEEIISIMNDRLCVITA